LLVYFCLHDTDCLVKAGLHCSMWMLTLDESLKSIGVNSPFIKNDHPRWRMNFAAFGWLAPRYEV